MADEQTPEPKDELLELPTQIAPEEKKEEVIPEAPFATEPEELIDPQVFWDNITSQTTATVHSSSGKPIKGLYAADQVNEVVPFTGSIAFNAFPDAGRSFDGDVKLLFAPADDKEAPKVSLILRAGGIMEAIAKAIKKYNKPGKEGRALMDKAIAGVPAHLPEIFEIVFKAIKEKSGDLEWTTRSKAAGGESTPLVELIYSGVDDQDLDPMLHTAFDGKKAEIKAAAEKILGSGKKEKKRKEPAFVKQDALVRKFVETLPKDRFKPLEGRMMSATLPLEEVESLGGKELADAIRSTPKSGAFDWQENGDGKTFWYLYDPKSNTVTIENKSLTDKMVMERIQKIWGTQGGGPPQDMYEKIADAYKVTTDGVRDWFKKLIERLSPEKKEKVEEILDLKEGIKKVAYPDSQWAGPSLDQVGALVGAAQAQWASELAGSLAAKFDYISFPKMEGGPNELKKLATLPLSPEQIARVERNRAPAMEIMKQMYGSRPAYESEDFALQAPQREELERLAEDTLLELAEATPSSMSDEEFLKELKHELMKLISKIHTQPHSHWPSSKANPEDALQGDNPSFDTVTEAPQEVEMYKTALMTEEDAVQVIPGHPDVPRQFQGQIGKVRDVKGDIWMCPEHGPEPFIRYLIEMGNGELHWFREDEIREAGSVN